MSNKRNEDDIPSETIHLKRVSTFLGKRLALIVLSQDADVHVYTILFDDMPLTLTHCVVYCFSDEIVVRGETTFVGVRHNKLTRELLIRMGIEQPDERVDGDLYIDMTIACGTLKYTDHGGWMSPGAAFPCTGVAADYTLIASAFS